MNILFSSGIGGANFGIFLFMITLSPPPMYESFPPVGEHTKLFFDVMASRVPPDNE